MPEPMEADDLFPVPSEHATLATGPFELRPKFVGRQSVLVRLAKAFDDTRELGELSFVLIVAEPGMGKTRVLNEFSRSLMRKDPQARFLVGAPEPSGHAYSAFATLLAARFGITPSDTREEAQEKITGGVAEVMRAAQVIEVSHLIAHLIRIPFIDSPVIGTLASSPQQLESRSFIALKRFLAGDAGRQPLVLCFENLESCPPETVNLLHYLAAGLALSPVVIIATGRESLFERHPTFGEGEVPLQRLRLGPLTDAEAVQLLRELCRPLKAVPPVLINHATRFGGTPRALYDLVRLLLESDVIVPDTASTWKIDQDVLDDLRLPTSHQDLVAERVRIMSEHDRDILEKAAAVGELSWLDSIVALIRVEDLETDDPDGPTLAQIAAAGDNTRVRVAQTLARLVEHEWLVEVDKSSVPGEREYRFAYPYLWSSVYAGIAESIKESYHKLIAQWLELRPEGRAALVQEHVGRHLEAAGDLAGAARRFRRAADSCRANFFNDRAIRLYSHVLECLGPNELAERIHVWHDLGSIWELRGEYEAALGAFERMLRLAWVAASRTKAAVAFNKMGRVWRLKGDLKLALEYLERGQELFEQAGDSRGIAGSLDDIGRVLYLLGRYDEAFERVTAALSRRGTHGDKRSVAHSLTTLGNIQRDRGRHVEAFNCHEKALDLRRQTGDRAGVITSLNNLAVLAFDRGDIGEARAGWEQALSEAEEIGALPLQALALCHLGELALIEHRHEEARRRLEDGLEIAGDIDDRQLQVEATRNLALLEYSGGDLERARELAQHAHKIAASAGLRDNEGRALLTLAEVLGGTLFDEAKTEERLDDLATVAAGPSAEVYYEQGLSLLREIGNASELAKGLERYGRYKIEHGDLDSGREMLEEALSIFTRLGMRQSAEVQRVLAAV